MVSEMIAYGRARAAGKTHELITKHFLAGNFDSILLVHSNQEKERLVKQYMMSKKDADRIMTYEFAKERPKGQRRRLLVDNIDFWVWQMYGQELEAMTFTGESR